MGSSHMSLFAILVLVVPAFSRIHPSPIDDAIQPKVSQGPVKHFPPNHAKDVKHHEHSDPSPSSQSLDDSDDTSSYKSEIHENDDVSSQGSNGELENQEVRTHASEGTPKSQSKHRRCPPGTTLAWDEDARSFCAHGYFTDGI